MFDERAKWLTFDPALPCVCVYKKFICKNPAPAQIEICGLGWFELYLNGARVSEDMFVPAWSDYRKRDFSTLLYPTSDEMTHRSYYLRYDATPFLKRGENVLCAMIGNGWYRQTERVIEGRNHYGEELRLRFDLCADDGLRVLSDEACVYAGSFVKENNLFTGERQDLADFDPGFACQIPDRARPCRIAEPFESELCLQDCPADRVAGEIGFCKISQEGNHAIYRADETVSGWAVLLSRGGDLRVRYADGLTETGELDFSYTGGASQIMEDVFEHTQAGQRLQPRFCWHAFTYFQTEGNCEVDRVQIVHANVAPRVKFHCNQENLNWLFSAFLRTQLDNMHCGVPSDCPHRERLGYTGDGQLVCETAMLFLDAEKFYKKWIRDILDCQDIASGHVQHTAPFYGGGGGPGGWGSAIVSVPYRHYACYGDRSVLEESFPHMQKWVDSMETFSEAGLVVREYEGGWCLGEWCTPDPLALPEPFVNTYFYIKALVMLEEICGILGKPADRFVGIRKRCEQSFRWAYFREDGSFLNSVQGADAFGLDLGLGDARTAKHLCEKYGKDPRFDTGIFGTDVLCNVLARLGEYEILFRLLAGDDYPSFGFMRKAGASTLWEDWDGHNSRNHPMFGACAKHLVQTFAGITFKNGRARIAPVSVQGLDTLACEVDGSCGRVGVRFRKEGDRTLVSAFSEREAVFVGREGAHTFSGAVEFEL